LDQLRDDVRSGRSAALVVRGEPGIGKTALLRYLAESSAAEFRVVEVAGVESEMEFAYAGLHQLCLPMLDHLGSLPDPQQSALRVSFGLTEGTAANRFFVGLATLSLLAEMATTYPLMCLVDDAQWLDDGSFEVLGFVARRLAAESVAMVFAIRDGDGPDRGRTGLPELVVTGVADEHARALLDSVVPGRLDERVRKRLVDETRGNPLALLELPRGMSPAELAGGFAVPGTGGMAAQVESHYVRRVRALPELTQRLMLLAATDAVGDVATIWRAAARLGIGPDAAAAAALEHLLDIGAGVRFHHPLVRSAVYGSASEEERQTAHRALAEATDPDSDADRRAWHQAHATSGPDDEIADELERSAARAQARGGYAAAAALLERSTSLTPEPSRRVERRLAAAQSHLRAGSFDAALGTLAVAESETSDEFVRVRVELLRGLVAAASNAGSDAPVRLVQAARRLERLDPALARQTYSDAWGAALYAGHLAGPGGSLVDVSRATRAAPRPNVPRGPFGQVIDGLAILVSDGRAVAEPVLRGAVQRLLSEELPADYWLHWGVLGAVAAAALWDVDGWSAVSTRQVALARELGALSVLPTALNVLALVTTLRGDLEAAAVLVAEHDSIKEATGIQVAPYGAMLLSAYRGRVPEASALVASTTRASAGRGEGLGIDLARWSAAILHNGISQYTEALATAAPASAELPGLLVSTWMLSERVEAAVRCEQPELARSALADFERTAHPGQSDWGLGVAARSRAMLSDGDEAEDLYRESVSRLGRAGVKVEQARAHLVFGEWLRRGGRRSEARTELRIAHEMFVAMSAGGFSERARRELVATGVHVRTRGTDSSDTELTSQELQIARLARDGRSNSEIATELFLSARTVEWHLRKVFIKLGITSRRGLPGALPARVPTASSSTRRAR
jgi:DNA-binding CsgD family transcriptional regulator